MKKNVTFQHILNIAILAFAALSLALYFVDVPALRYIAAGVLIFANIATFPQLTRGTQLVLAVLFGIGAFLLIRSGASFDVWLDAILSNANLITLLILVPMISSPFYYEDYQSELANLAKLRMHSVLSFLLLVSVVNHVLSVIISVGAVMIVYDLLSPYAKLYKAEKPFLTTVSRSYNSSGFWSPAWASVIVYSAVKGVEWIKVIPVGIVMTCIFLAMHLFSIYVETRRYPDRYPKVEAEEGTKLDGKKLGRMLLVTLAMILAIVLLNVVTKWDLMVTVSIVALLFPFLVARVQHKMHAYEQLMGVYYRAQVPKVCSQAALFMLSGFFGRALSVSGMGELFVKLLPEWLIGSTPLMVGALMILLILPAMAGVHPAATGTALVTSITPAALGLTSYTFGLAIIVGWLFTIMMAPYSATALMLSSLTGKNNYYVSIGINWAFTIVGVIVFSLLIAVIGPLMG